MQKTGTKGETIKIPSIDSYETLGMITLRSKGIGLLWQALEIIKSLMMKGLP